MLVPGRRRSGGRLWTAQANIPFWATSAATDCAFCACARKAAKALLLLLCMAAGALLLAPWGLLGPKGAMWFYASSCRRLTGGRLCMRAVRVQQALSGSVRWSNLGSCCFSEARLQLVSGLGPEDDLVRMPLCIVITSWFLACAATPASLLLPAGTNLQQVFRAAGQHREI